MTRPADRSTGTRALALLCSVAIMLAAWCGPASISAHAQSPKQLRTRAKVVARHAKPAFMVTVPAGWFLMGTEAKAVSSLALGGPFDDTEVPQRRIWLDAYELDRDEVSLGKYLDGILQKPRALPPDLAELELLRQLAEFASLLLRPKMPPDKVVASWPAIKVTWFDADTYCHTECERLPSEAEWEKAARGKTGLLFPWGNAAPDVQRAVFAQVASKNGPLVKPVDSLPDGRSPFGLHHMAGNVAEWVEEWSGTDSYASMPDRNPTGPTNGRSKVVRGGSWKSTPTLLRAATRGGAPPDERATTIGFRCAKLVS
ncbi:MAG: formylglycine-generating enzyme family protein [Nitrospiraceae bacterium]